MRVGFLLGVSFGSLGCVDCFPLKDFQMCPFAVASDFLEEFLDKFFGESLPCGDEIVFYCGYQCGCAWAPQREVDKSAQI